MLNKVEKNNFKLTHKLGKFPVIISLSVMAFMLPGCEVDDRREAFEPVPPGNVVTETVTDQTDQLIGKTVTIRSQPIRKISPSAFTVIDEKMFGTQNLLVINSTEEPFQLPETTDTEIQVTGQVERFNLDKINQDYKLNLQPDLYQEYENQPVIIAQSLALSPTPGELTTNPNVYYGKTLAVTGEVENIDSPVAFTLNEDKLLGTQDLLVLHTKSEPVVREGEKVAVTGVLRPFVVADLERDYDITWDLDLQRKLEAEYRDKPVLVATDVYPSAIPQ
ncbi:hypothetical protein [Sphaerospermopsis sp. LEGE 08334]|jgi:hypothetical protein|uniref:hypothetical protein n=1 Tax=Sphaerospermopsis sp. LEGE 08334 TaxID=1828651 RepID=UPI001D13A5AC|nr:hypothetical protein [Sphaerospermopsis sp. LEGE 08334]